jgi:hypothetical protein
MKSASRDGAHVPILGPVVVPESAAILDMS